ncbi:hypothetical protein [Paludifilum halophilum]|uniref:hypothetical protein n=1 Tax=Paludifilum halophilum TaxID=1642702 RepID=UPI00146A214C|nr:hypothetical protein [Paludifilum halophilum]
MVQSLVDTMLGPYGKMISDWYLDRQVVINTFIVLIGIYRLFKRRKNPSTAA